MSRITTKGQATIPKSVRKLLNVRPHDRVIFRISGKRVWLEGQGQDLGSLFGKYHASVPARVTVEDMNKAIRSRKHA